MFETILKALPLFQSLKEEDIHLLLKSTSHKLIHFKTKDFIAFQGDKCKSLYILCKGKVSAQMGNEEGKILTIEVLTAPEILAPAFIFATENNFPVDIVALEECEIVSINRNDFLKIMHENIHIMQAFILDISDRSMFLSKKLNEFALQGLRSRIINYLKNQQYIKNQQAVALRLGVARPSLIKVLTEMINEGILERNKEGIFLKK